MSPMRDPGRPRLNEKLDHAQARHPFLYNLGTGALIGLVLLVLQVHWIGAVVYAVSWATLRAFLWGEGRILRRQYEARLARVERVKENRRRQR